MARRRRSDPCRHASGVSVRLSQSFPLACALLSHHRRLAGISGLAGRACAVRSGGRFRHRANVAGVDRDRRLRADRLSLHARVRSRGAADPDLVPARGLGDCGRDDDHRQRHQRYRRPRIARRPGADRDADRLHRDAARIRRRRRLNRHRFRRRATGAGACRIRRSDLGLGCLLRQGLHQPRDGIAARPQARDAGRPGGQMARSAAPARSGSFPCRARQRARPAPRPPGAGLPPAHAGWTLHVVRAEGPSRRRLRRRGLPRDRHLDRRHREQERRGAHVAQLGARQPHGSAEPQAVHRPPGRGRQFRQELCRTCGRH